MIKSFFKLLKNAFVFDHIDLYLLLISLVVGGIDVFIWKLQLKNLETQSFWIIPISPIQFLIIVYVTNLILGVSSFDKEKKISYLLFAANIFLAALILVLEILYILHAAPII
jgi:hypothetical protein